MKKVFDNIKTVTSIAPASITANTNGSGVDTLGFNDAMVQIIAGAIDTTTGDETYSFKVQDSADNSTFADVTGLTNTVTATGQLKEIRLAELNLVTKRYIRVVLTVAGTTPIFVGGAVVLLGNPTSGPVANA